MEFPNCRFFHYDAFRGREVMLCRLLERSAQMDQWSLKLCESCPVPGLLRESSCDHLLLEAGIGRRFNLFPRVEVYAVCGEAMETLSDPRRCPTCERRSDQKHPR